MVERIDPEGSEVRVTRRHVSFEGRDVLEVGCGSGRLTFQYAPSARSVVAVDPSRGAIAGAKKHLNRFPEPNLTFRVANAESLPFHEESFDIVFFAWSLCCTDVPAMGRALAEAWRVLRPQGVLASMQPSLQQDFRYGMVGYLMERGSPAIQEEERTYAKSRLALRYVVLMARQFDLVAEVEFPSYTYYDSEAEAIRAFVSGRREAFRSLDRKTKLAIREIVYDRAARTERGVRFEERAVLTVLRKRTESR